ncbi:hypothetical protein C8J57DRAFT_1731255, partial [Mycena rebaudengoi]
TINSWPVTYKVAAIHRLRIITFGKCSTSCCSPPASRSSSCLTKLQLRSKAQLAYRLHQPATRVWYAVNFRRAPFLGLDLRAASLCLSAASGSVLSTLVFALRKRVVHLVDPASIAYSRTIDK